MKCGLLGRKLGHSYSPQIHGMLGDYSYDLFEVEPDDLPSFLQCGDFDGLNVTIPYKKDVMPFCSELSPRAKQIGSVNTIVRRSDGSLYGDNTDAFGFEWMLRKAGIKAQGKKALILGSGGASVMANVVLRELGAAEVITVSRSGPDNYSNLSKHADAQLIVNTTPVGMYPKTGVAAVQLDNFSCCEGVADVVYNPQRTALILDAERHGIPCVSGLSMLVAQAKRSSELFQNVVISDDQIDRIEYSQKKQMLNLVLIGMPGSGKSTIARELSEKLGRERLELDALIEEHSDCTIPEIFAQYGENEFRRRESEVVAECGKQSGKILSTGGGVVTRPENYDSLHQNGIIFWIQRNTDLLPTEGRPISQNSDLRDLLKVREPLYAAFADYMIDNNGSITETVNKIMDVFR